MLIKRNYGAKNAIIVSKIVSNIKKFRKNVDAFMKREMMYLAERLFGLEEERVLVRILRMAF
ncbi:MAG: hypothetical protein CMK07_00985 [Ponticaulis sp.]|nr:hypothetical protein [Ponticaulis sp.]